MSVASGGRRFLSLPKIAITASLAVFLTLAGSGVSYAMWTASARVDASVSAGAVTVAVTQTDGAHFRNDSLSSTGSFTVTNTSTAAGKYSVVISAAMPGSATQIHFTVWPRVSASSCDAVPTAGGIPVGAVKGSLAPGSAVAYCLQTTVSDRSTLATSTGLFSFTTTVDATLAVGSWKGTATATATHPSADIYPETSLDSATTNVFRNVDQHSACVAVTPLTAAVLPPDCTNVATATQIPVAQLRNVDNYQLVAADSGLCAQAKDDGNGLEQVTCDGTPAQQFTLEPEAAPSL